MPSLFKADKRRSNDRGTKRQVPQAWRRARVFRQTGNNLGDDVLGKTAVTVAFKFADESPD